MTSLNDDTFTFNALKWDQAQKMWGQAQEEVTVPVSDVKFIRRLDNEVKEAPGYSTVIARHSAAPLLVSPSIQEVFSGENEKVELGLVRLMYGASNVTRSDNPVGIEELKMLQANRNAGEQERPAHWSTATKGGVQTRLRVSQPSLPLIDVDAEPFYTPPPTVGELQMRMGESRFQGSFVNTKPMINRRKAILIGSVIAAGLAIAGTINKLTELPKLTPGQKQDLIDTVDSESRNKDSAGMEFYTKDSETVYYTSEDLKLPKIQEQIKTNIQDDYYRNAKTFDVIEPDNQNNQSDSTRYNNPPNDDIAPPDAAPDTPRVQQINTRSSASPAKKTSFAQTSRPQTLSRRALFANFAPKKTYG